MARDPDRVRRALERAAEKGRTLKPAEIERLYAREPQHPGPILGLSPLERRIQLRKVDPPR